MEQNLKSLAVPASFHLHVEQQEEEAGGQFHSKSASDMVLNKTRKITNTNQKPKKRNVQSLSASEKNYII